MAIFSAVNRYLAKLMNQFPQYDVAMTETHHVHKLDAPSGTAITLAEEICQNLDRKTEWKKGTTTWDEKFFRKALTILEKEAVIVMYTGEIGFVKKQLRLHREFSLLEEYCMQSKTGCYLFIIGVKR